MTKNEALKLALEAMEVANSCVDGYYIPKGKTQLPEVEEAITAIREALAQPEPVQVSPLEFNHMTLDKEHLVGKPIFWAEWPNRAQPDYKPTSDHRMMENAQGELERITLVQTGVGIGKPEQEPVAWITKNGKGWLRWHRPEDNEKNKDSIPLYTAPPHRKPLTDEQIDAIYTGVRAVHHEIDSYVFARAIEAAHGIKEHQ